MKKFFKKKWVQYVLLLIAAVILCGVASRLTSGFTVFDVEEMFSVKLNEDNYFYEKIDDGVFYSDANVDAVADKGIITFNCEIPDTDASAVTVAEEIELATIQLKAGTYTFTCFDDEKPTWKTYYATGTYVIDGVTYTWYADMDKAPNNSANSGSLLGKTVELEKDTIVVFEVHLCEGVELNNVKAVPVLVEGDEDGAYSNGIIG